MVGNTQTNSNHVKVDGYYRSDGTYVNPYYRTAPNKTNKDNFSTRGNVNPYTDKSGWIYPDNHHNVPNYPSMNSLSYNSSTLDVYTTIKSSGQLWKEPNQFNLIMAISKDTKVKVIGYEEGFWKVIAYDGTIGYIYNSTISINHRMYELKENTNKQASNNYSLSNRTSYKTSPIYTTLKSNGQLWREPNQFNRIRSISGGSRVEVIGCKEDFWKVNSKGTISYI